MTIEKVEFFAAGFDDSLRTFERHGATLGVTFFDSEAEAVAYTTGKVIKYRRYTMEAQKLNELKELAANRAFSHIVSLAFVSLNAEDYAKGLEVYKTEGEFKAMAFVKSL